MPYLTQKALEGLKAYTYKPGGYTWLDNLHQPFWNWFVQQLPFWLAPNLITLAGLLGVFVTYWTIAIFQPSFSGTSPSWALVLAGFSVCVYANLDCIDGKQARRTDSSSPLGQLFDHGCDAYIVHLLIGNMIASMGETCGWRASFGTLWITSPWMLAQLEEYHTGLMLYGNGVWGVLEALYATAAACFGTALIGATYWQSTVFFLPQEWNISKNALLLEAVPSNPVHATSGLVDAVLFLLMGTGGVQIIGQVWRILLCDGTSMSETEKGDKKLGVSNAIWHFFLVFVLLATGTIWIWTARENECRLAYTAYGTAYALVATQLIVAHMAKIDFAPFWWCLPSLVVFAVNSAFPLINPAWMALISCLLYNITYGHYTVSIVRQICVFLDIWCLSIKKKKTGND